MASGLAVRNACRFAAPGLRMPRRRGRLVAIAAPALVAAAAAALLTLLFARLGQAFDWTRLPTPDSFATPICGSLRQAGFADQLSAGARLGLVMALASFAPLRLKAFCDPGRLASLAVSIAAITSVHTLLMVLGASTFDEFRWLRLPLLWAVVLATLCAMSWRAAPAQVRCRPLACAPMMAALMLAGATGWGWMALAATLAHLVGRRQDFVAASALASGALGSLAMLTEG
jgi:hypothetical protein